MTTTSHILTQKTHMRAHYVELRRRAFAQTGESAAQALAGRAGEMGLAPGAIIAAYWPMGDEMDPRPLMGRLQDLGCSLALPVVAARGRPLDFRAYKIGDSLEPGLHGTFHPLVAMPIVVPEAMLIPLLAFDRQCFRLGYGGGYYDRTLESLRKKAQIKTIGLAFAVQEVSAVPRDGHDQRLDAIATEHGLITAETA